MAAPSWLEMLPKAKAARPDVPVIIVTGTPSPQTQADTSIKGALAYLEKPLDPEHLRRQVSLAIWGPQ